MTAGFEAGATSINGKTEKTVYSNYSITGTGVATVSVFVFTGQLIPVTGG